MYDKCMEVRFALHKQKTHDSIPNADTTVFIISHMDVEIGLVSPVQSRCWNSRLYDIQTICNILDLWIVKTVRSRG
jgi:hypothetical protein